MDHLGWTDYWMMARIFSLSFLEFLVSFEDNSQNNLKLVSKLWENFFQNSQLVFGKFSSDIRFGIRHDLPTINKHKIHGISLISLTKLMVSHDPPRSKITNQIAFAQQDLRSTPEFERTMGCRCQALVSKLETSDTITFA